VEGGSKLNSALVTPHAKGACRGRAVQNEEITS
jgi:hypothetical protein